MRRAWLLIALCAILLGLKGGRSSAKSSLSWDENNRIPYLKKALFAIRKAKEDDLENARKFVNLTHNTCKSSLPDLKLSCMISGVNRYCKGRGDVKICRYYGDVLMINRLNEGSFLKKRRRYEIMRTRKDYRKAFYEALMHRYAGIATQFYLLEDFSCKEDDWDCIAPILDRFCRDYNNRGKITYQTCAGALVWFIGVFTS